MEPITEEIVGIANMPREQREEMENSTMLKGFMAAMERMSEKDRMIGLFFEKTMRVVLEKISFCTIMNIIVMLWQILHCQWMPPIRLKFLIHGI